MRLLVTGAAGFIGSNFCEFVSRRAQKYNLKELVMVDSQTRISSPDLCKKLVKENTPDSFIEKVAYYKANICNEDKILNLLDEHGIDHVVNFAASTFVDESIRGRHHCEFHNNNYVGVTSLLEVIGIQKKFGSIRFVHISTDEVFGSGGPFYEDSPFNPQNPYAATKVAAEGMIRAYRNTYGIQTMVVRFPNLFGPRQHPEKAIPNWITAGIFRRPMYLYGKGEEKRQWCPVRIACHFLADVLTKGMAGEDFNLKSGYSCSNKELIKLICWLVQLEVDYSLIEFIGNRLGHDKEYILKSKNDFTFNHGTNIDFRNELKKTVHWYIENENWWREKVGGITIS